MGTRADVFVTLEIFGTYEYCICVPMSKIDQFMK